MSQPSRNADPVLVRASPETVIWGAIDAARAPVQHVRPGQTVRIDTVSQQPLNYADPATFLPTQGIRADEILPEHSEIYHQVKKSPPGGPHVLTGPLYIEGAEAGDMLEVRVIDVAFRVPYGMNAIGPGSGVLPDLMKERITPVIRLDLERRVALFAGLEIPLAPFMGIMAVAPPPEHSPWSTKPPAEWGGNIDFRHMIAGSTLYLPVFNKGALFYTGDGHATQGDGEVDGAAIEISLTPTFEFHVHKNEGTRMKWPRAEDADNHYVMGMDEDLDIALKEAVREAVEFIQRKAHVTAAQAYALCTFKVDFRIGEAVNQVKMVYGAIPKELLRRST